MRQVILLFVLLASLSLSAQEDFQIVKGNCLPDLEGGSHRASGRHKLPAINKQWDATKTYKQAVVLIEFDELTPEDPSDDTKFYKENAAEYYNRLFNEEGFTERHSKGSIADYFRVQSGGLFNLGFDVYGPVTVHQKAQPYASPDEKTRNYGRDVFVEAANKVIAANPDIDWKQYDWNGDGYVNQVIFVYAGFAGNGGEVSYGYIWPNTSAFSTITAPDGTKISDYSSSGERWGRKSVTLCGLGTICHEFTHSLGLPDLYRTDIGDNIVIDMWGLMDGGNFINYGFCPPNYTPLEKMLLGWLEPEELTEATTVEALEYGKVYKITNTEDDYYLLENRVWQGWDEGIPGKGLCVYHVLWDASRWRNNTVNNKVYNDDTRHYDLVHADGLDYYQWVDKIGSESGFANSGWMNCYALSGSPFPYVPTEGDAVTSFEEVEGKPVTNIQMNADGTISFDFMGGATAVSPISSSHLSPLTTHYFDLQGRRIDAPLRGQLYIVRKGDGTTRKYLYQ